MFDPTKPIEGSVIDAAELRSQFQGLKALIDALPGVTGATVTGTTTTAAGSPAVAGVALNGTQLEFTFDIPQGMEGQPGLQGSPFAGVTIDGVTTLDPTQPAAVSAFFDGATVHLQFSIPRGHDGVQGNAGEVSAQQLSDGLTNLNNAIPSTNGVATLDGALATAELELVRGKLNEIILALRR
jgi:hypothetical protein